VIRQFATMFLAASGCLACALPAFGQGIVTEMTPALIEEAIRTGERGRIADTGLYRGAFGVMGDLRVGFYSTPYLRVALAARLAKRDYRTFTPADVTPDMLVPELHIYAFPQVAGAEVSNVTAVVVTPRKGTPDQKRDRAIHPLRVEPLTTQWANLFGAKFEGQGRIAAFPLSVLSEQNEVHVVYDRPATIGDVGRVGSRHCTDCDVEFYGLKKVK
jgi:hypothetical protein